MWNIRLFVTLKDLAGTNFISVTGEASLTVAELLNCISNQYPCLAYGLPSAVVAVNLAYADQEMMVDSADEIALFPPVSGG